MSLYGEYVKETRGIETLEDERGFATYSIKGEECYIESIYVAPGFRKTNVARYMTDEIRSIAKTKGCKYLTGSINLDFKNCEASMFAQLAYGFKLAVAANNIIFLKMEI